MSVSNVVMLTVNGPKHGRVKLMLLRWLRGV